MPGGRPDEQGVYLLDLTVGGHVHRYATETVEVTTASGETLRYLEGLGEPGLTYGSVFGVADASVAVEILGEVDWALLVARGHALDRCPCVLRRWYPGRVLERARVVLRGLSSAPSYGAKGEPLSLSIVRSISAQTRTIPPPQAVVDSSTWPVTASHSIPDNVDGALYPLVIGAPGGTEDATPVCVVPVPQVEWRSIDVFCKVAWLGGHASQIRRRYDDNDPPTEADEAAATTDDLLGRAVSYALTDENDANGKYYVGFRDDATYGGGIVYRGALLRGAGSIIEWVLKEHYAGAVDHARVAAAKSYLDNWKIDTWISSPVNAYDWLAAEVLPLIPVEMREGSSGVYPALLRYDLRATDAVAHLDATDGSGRVSRASAVTLVGDVVNEVTIDYRPSGDSGAKWLARRVLTAQASRLSGDDGTDTDDTRILSHPLARQSQTRYGVRPVRLQLSAVWDTTTALLVGQHLLARQALPRLAVQYSGGAWLEEIEIGQAVTLTDPELHLTDAVALVVDVTPGPESVVDLLILDARRATT